MMLSLVLAQGLAAVAIAQVEDEDAPRSQAGTPTFHFIGDRYRVGIGLDSEFDVIGEFEAAVYESQRSSFIGDGWLGSEGAGGVKLNYHWLINETAEEGPDGPVYTDGNVAKLFVAADQNQLEDRKLTFGGGWEGRKWAFSGYGMTALSDERLVDRGTTIEEMLVSGEIDGRAFSRVDTIETVTEWFEEPYEWGLGLRAERFFENPLLRLRGGLDYEEGDFSSSQVTASLSLDKHFHKSPHSLSFRTSYAHKDGDFVVDDSDLRGSVVYSFSFGGADSSFRPLRQYRDVEVEVPGEPRTEERVTINEVTLTDRTTFDFDSSELKSGAENTLDEIVAAIEDGGLVGDIQIVGHTCDIGTEAYNQGLSERRARSVVDYLSANGVDSGDIEWRGEGETEPRFPNDSEENRSRNRRVEISFATERKSTKKVTVGPDESATEIRQVEVPVEAPWIRRALRNPVRHKRIVDYYRYQESTASVTEGEVEFANEAPQAADDQFTVETDSVDNALDVLANDSDADGDPLTLVGVTQPANGQASVSGDQVIYTPESGFAGSDSFSYTVEDGFGGEASATVSVTVESPNEPPVVGDLTANTLRNQSVDIDVLAEATDPDGDELSIAGFTQPDNGTVTQSGDELRYLPDDEFVGSDSFTFTISDGRGGEASGTVTIDVAFANRAPVANPDAAETTVGQPVTVDVLANDFDPDGDPLEIVDVVQWYGMPAEVTVNNDGTITFRVSDSCNGRNRFRYTISDPSGATAQANVSVNRVSGSDTENASPECVGW
ncbi:MULTISPECIES: Ig-like domain-containing protein [unclassified Wenzhouxiangella]|uniref:Ig-like domain-containing protein n=1 Tax=unclassified Wenzhouxiangella TaxID=2613841 RepID=UPI0015F26EA3|nr:MULTISPECIES: Ig-like domain-containing protein [unclassified Wenzhouxiangella]